jgi:Potential Queuosine, Q, salvage protein family
MAGEFPEAMMVRERSFDVDTQRAKRLGEILRSLRYVPDEMRQISPFADDTFRDVHFIFFMTAIDHNTHTADSRYEAMIDGRCVHGSDLMYAMAIAAAKADTDLFTPSGMRAVSAEHLTRILTTPDGQMPIGIEERADLLRDAADGLVRRYAGDLEQLFNAAGHRIASTDGPGIAARLSAFRAYQDPIGKKTFLLIKLLRRRRRLAIADPENIRVPIDHVVFTLALRSGLVVASPAILRDIRTGVCLRDSEVLELREICKDAYVAVGRYAQQTADEFDDLLWGYGRECLREGTPFPDEKIATIEIGLDDRIGNRGARDEFLRFIMGIDAGARPGLSSIPVPTIPPTWYI